MKPARKAARGHPHSGQRNREIRRKQCHPAPAVQGLHIPRTMVHIPNPRPGSLDLCLSLVPPGTGLATAANDNPKPKANAVTSGQLSTPGDTAAGRQHQLQQQSVYMHVYACMVELGIPRPAAVGGRVVPGCGLSGTSMARQDTSRTQIELQSTRPGLTPTARPTLSYN